MISIYMLKFYDNNQTKIYVGSSKNINRRINEHKRNKIFNFDNYKYKILEKNIDE